MRTLILFLTACCLVHNTKAILDQLDEQEFDWCMYDHGSDDFMLGDFNGDNRDDILCNHQCSGPFKGITFNQFPYHYNPVDWEEPVSLCTGDSPFNQLFLADFNGDTRDDMLCHDYESDSQKQLFALPDGTFDELIVHYTSDFCVGPNLDLYIGDFNGDKREDQLCHSRVDGTVWIVHADESGKFDQASTWKSELNWCFNDYEKLYTGKFTDDQLDDMICHSKINGEVWIMVAMNDGYFYNEHSYWAASNLCVPKNTTLYTGDFNNDRRDDLLCRAMFDIYIIFANPDGSFGPEIWEKKQDICVDGDQFYVTHIDGDNIADLMCRVTREEVSYMYTVTTSPQMLAELEELS